jgi:mono/diheme cytochrome c family protein
MNVRRWCLLLLVILVVAVVVWLETGNPKPGEVLDEARLAQRELPSFPAADNDYFHDMDGAIALSADEVKGRNMWLVWTGGNDRFWDAIHINSFGILDFLKTVSSYDPDKDSALPSQQRANVKARYKFSRDNRWHYLGLVNEPCFRKADGPDPNRFGLWFDQRLPGCQSDPFEDAQKYPGVHIGARGKSPWQEGSDGSYYGYASGIVGLRLFPNPKFDAAAAKRWNPEKYYTDPNYYNSKDLVRPFRVGMSCAFCHVGPNPLKPPNDPENPEWANLSSNVVAQYFWIDRIFSWEADPTNYIFQLFHTSRPGSLDTSLVSTDNINNPRTMNAVYYLGPRLALAKEWGKETLSGGGLLNKQFNDFIKTGPLTELYDPPQTVRTPHVLKDGSDSVGALGALNRVYLNIGLFSEEWLLHFKPLIGGKRVTPIEIAVASRNSTYWQATESQTPDMARFFLASTEPHHLKDAPGGAKFLTEDQATVTRGKVVFSERCARCHSSKFPSPPQGSSPGNCAGPQYLECWNKYWEWTKTDAFKSQMRAIVLANDFLKDNVLSNDARVPVTLLHTNACSPLASNGIGGNI